MVKKWSTLVQSVFIAAVESGDPLMLDVFLPSTPGKILGPDGKEYPNPKKDLHTLTASACEPSYFKGKEHWEWDGIAREKGLNPYIKGSMRDMGKTVNFGESIAEVKQG